jgi:hypothetical protein
MHAALIKISLFILETKQYIRSSCKGSLYIILNVLSNETNLIHIAIIPLRCTTSSVLGLFVLEFKDDVHSVLRISSAHNKGGHPDINIAQILHLSNFFELKRIVYIPLQV